MFGSRLSEQDHELNFVVECSILLMERMWFEDVLYVSIGKFKMDLPAKEQAQSHVWRCNAPRCYGTDARRHFTRDG
jgi:hypothetical protein